MCKKTFYFGSERTGMRGWTGYFGKGCGTHVFTISMDRKALSHAYDY